MGAAPSPRGEVVVAPMRRRHLRAVLRIEGANQARPWSLGLFMAELARPDDRCYRVAWVGGEVVGFAGMLFVAGDGHLTNLSVAPTWQGHGVGTRLLDHVVRHALARGDIEALTLEVRAGNARAQALYRRFGFAPVGVRRAYYEDNGEDAVVMWAHDVATDAYAERLAAIAADLAAEIGPVAPAEGARP